MTQEWLRIDIASVSQMYVEELRNESEWEDFIETIPEATFYHTIEWKKIIEKSFGFVPAYLTIKDQGEIAGVCPGFVTTPLGFRIFTSLPNSDYGGPLFSKAHLARGMTFLRNFLTGYCSENGISHSKLCLLGDSPKQFLEMPFTHIDRSKGIVEIDLKATPPEFIWSKLLSGEVRRRIKRFENDGFRLEQIRSRSELEEFYCLYRSNMRYIHAPEYSYRFFENIWSKMSSGEFRVWLVNGRLSLGGTACFVYRKRLYLVYVGINRKLDLSRYNVTPYMCWSLTKWADEQGLRYVSMGSTPANPQDSHYRLKIRFGAKFIQQNTVLIPYTYNAKTLFAVRNSVVSSWKAVRSILPTNFKTSLERRLFQL